jgi:hypothetical protein
VSRRSEAEEVSGFVGWFMALSDQVPTSRGTQRRTGTHADAAAARGEHASLMPTTQNANPKNSGAFYMQAIVSFGVALFAVLVAVYYLPADPWIKAF